MEAGSLLRGEFCPGGAEREWCDPDVLRILRRRSLARLRREVEPVEPAALARFSRLAGSGGGPGALPGTLGADVTPRLRGEAALERLAEVVDQLAGVPIPASVLERERPAGCVPGYRPASSTSSGPSARWPGWAAGRWAATTGGSGSSGPAGATSCGRRCRRPGGERDPVGRERHAATARGWTGAGASHRELFTAAGGGSDRDVLDALWDLAWSGEVTNDTFAPLRALRWKRPGGDRRPRPGRLRPLGDQRPPGVVAAAGGGVPVGPELWTLERVQMARAPRSTASPATVAPGATERLHALALVLLGRHGG